MPITMVDFEEPKIIRKVGGREDTRKFLEGMGFVAGSEVTVVSKVMGNVIVSVKGAHIALGQDMASEIFV